ncbi:putative quinol monooxygenase [Sinisalibacter lacisalsi]|uniref:ABM domain-containing protein n=1 Tax=Sinisalibacter lacisalsi TaxID=1526570 RepID=A0ABQ1QKS8_9RHOB|nr:antibiotic biosynthesis monooxygenase [Sinisalibacter lacisalsi]GGD31770.1 hypothetical protein GCM10011358_14770 [Sinisalibacter lacisalsi]
MTPRFSLTGHFDVPAGRADAIAAALPGRILFTRAEAGCLAFHETPDQEAPGCYKVAGLFESRAAFEAHQARTAASDRRRIGQGLPRAYETREITP